MGATAIVRVLSLVFLIGFVPFPGLAEDDDEGLRQRLTEREDKRRPVTPFSVDLGGRPLTLGGEYELELLELRRWIVGEQIDEPNRRLLSQGLELEAFYSFGKQLIGEHVSDADNGRFL